MKYHVLNGDCLASAFPNAKLPGQVIVARECLIEGEHLVYYLTLNCFDAINMANIYICKLF
jgi:hypothetical protein